ncbi:Metallophosphoesterase domain-containing protein 2 [Pyrenophora tritici-repentis]|nr:Metallophosphoesterase domain-containing protein 2 [Pyrenophora tritici-repentis]KAI0606817.1 Metallophosphoesterase domain-containing protein 2 [Pyrenophora tritici-repentis]KAI0618818.1 Metallophosphoesterase domain-containing protein 2 [Pyrenophora tritici-repentis]KAI1531464.1 metallophosphoesterase domain-containing protein 2 [Pyrenophora tritici-repentis]KAI1571318.1 metallophosphoesterase domain-containing protein 2 [Pyrenophora tritici-repentis]
MTLAYLNPWHRPSSDFDPTPFLALLFRAPVKLLLYHTYHFVTYLRSAPPPPQRPPS